MENIKPKVFSIAVSVILFSLDSHVENCFSPTSFYIVTFSMEEFFRLEKENMVKLVNYIERCRRVLV